MEFEDEIVISGISGRFPECNNVKEFKDALLKGEDLLTVDDRRFSTGIKNLPKRRGKISDIDKFDASFFGLHPKQANFTDPRQRILLETVYEAIIDAGYNPDELRRSKTGVFVGLSLFTNFEELTAEDSHGYSILGASISCAANRISYCFDFTGPSYSLDTGCSSSLYALTHAVDYLKKGEIEYAVVGGTHIGLSPKETEQYNNLNMLSPDGACKVFSKERDGFARSEAVCAYFLMKKGRARRIYATVIGSKTNANGYFKEGYTFPSTEAQCKLMQELYAEAKVSTDDVAYVELHGTGSKVGDPVECQSLVNMFCNNRTKPLLIGSVKSNMGHGETAAGLAGITKVIIAMEYGTLPANIHYHPMDETLPGISDKRLKVVTSNTKYVGGIIAVNGSGIGGANAHVLLKPHKKKAIPLSKREHRLITVSGRTKEAVNYILEQFKTNENDEECFSLLDEIHKNNIRGHNFRGYTVIGKNPLKEIAKCQFKNRPIWFVYTGMGAHWPGMGKDLMHIEVFKNTITRCAHAVKPYGVDLMDIILNPSPAALQNLGNCFSAIIAISLALTDLLASIDIKPDFFIGHSLGEVGCAYANGDLTPEQAVLLAFAKYHACKQVDLPLGQMAAIGLSKAAITDILPEDIFVACQNGSDNVTISGPMESIKKFVAQLTQQGVFAKLVFTGQIAFHCKYLLDSPEHFRKFTQKLIPEPKPRSKKWLSSSVPSDAMDEKWANYNCADYHTNNFSNKVLFDRFFDHVQSNAIVVEIGPHGIMQAILKRELGSENTLLSLLNRHADNQEQYLWSSIGKIYNAGGQPNLRKLYKETVFPVSPGTRMIAPLVKWDHSTSWFVPYWKNKDSVGQLISINLSDEKYSFLKGHNIDGQVVMPAAAFLMLVWEAVANMHQKNITELSVVLENINFKRTVTLLNDGNVEFFVNIIKGSGNFEIFEGNSLAVTGNVRIPEYISTEFKVKYIQDNDDAFIVKRNDFYKEVHLRGYLYNGLFQGISECNILGLRGKIEWMNNYTSFLDAMLQLFILSKQNRSLFVPISIKKVVLEPIVHGEDIQKKYIDVRIDPHCNVTKSAGIEIGGLRFTQLTRSHKTDTNPILETFEYVYYDSPKNQKYDLSTSLLIAIQIVIQNTVGLIKKLTIVELKEHDIFDSELELTIKQILRNQVMTENEYFTIPLDLIKKLNDKSDIIIINEIIYNRWGLDGFKEYLKKNGFFLFFGKTDTKFDGFETIFRTKYVCLLKEKQQFPNFYDTINIRNCDFKWLNKLKKYADSNEKKTVCLFSQNEDLTGIIGLQNCLLSEAHIEFMSIDIDENANIFSIDDEFYNEQISKRLALNVLKNNNWGTYVYFPLKEVLPKYTDNAELRKQNPNKLQEPFWIEKPVVNIIAEDNSTLIYVHYAALSDSKCFGYSGITECGKRMMGLVFKERISFQIKSDPDLLWEVPNFWNMEQAATVSLDYLKCYYALILKGQLEKNETILITNGTSVIGLAAIAIAIHLSATVFTTVKNEEERVFLKKLYPLLNTKNIVIVNGSLHENLVKQYTKGQGVNLVFCSLLEDSLETSISCSARGGRIIQIEKNKDTQFILQTLPDTCSFHRIVIDDIFRENLNNKCKLKDLLTQGIADEVVKPLPAVTFEQTETEYALQLLFSEEKIKKKILLKLRDGKSSNLSRIFAYPRLFFNPSKIYIIIGGLGGIGIELANWLIQKGALKIVLNARRNVWNGYQAFCMRKWSMIKNVVVNIDLNDTTTLVGAERLVIDAQKLGPVGGIFHAASVLQDANVVDQTADKFEAVFKSKIISGKNMDTVTKKYCPCLDHFVVFSTVYAGRGNIGQTNYGMANSALERLCEQRRRENLPGIAIQWGPLETGFPSPTIIEKKIVCNMIPQSVTSCLDTLEKFIIQNVVIGSSLIPAPEKKSNAISTKKTIADAIANILGIENLDEIDQDSNLSCLGLDSLMLAEIKHTLYRHFELDFDPEEIRGLTFNYLINLQVENFKQIPPKNSQSFPPPMLSKTPVIKMKDNEIKNGKNLFLIHPIEGYLLYFKPLAKRIQTVHTIYGLQCTKESNFDTIEKTAAYFLKFVKEIQKKGPYYLCGYSYGASLGFEIGLQLEKEGETVQLLVIDGAPDYSRNIFTDSNDLNTKITRLFPSLFKEVNLDKVKKIMKSENSKESLSLIYQLISEETGIDLEDIAYAGRQYLNRCKASYSYYPSQKLKGKIKLVRRQINLQDKSEDYQLQQWCHSAVEVEKLNGDHMSILFDDNLTALSKIVNEWFDV